MGVVSTAHVHLVRLLGGRLSIVQTLSVVYLEMMNIEYINRQDIALAAQYQEFINYKENCLFDLLKYHSS